MSDAANVASDQMRRKNHKLRAIYLHIVKALLAQIERLQTAHHPALTPQQPGFVLVEIAKFGAQFIERQRNHINPFDFQWLIFLFIDRTDIEDHVVRAEAITTLQSDKTIEVNTTMVPWVLKGRTTIDVETGNNK